MPTKFKQPVVKSNTVKLIELKFGKDVCALLRSDYLEDKLTIQQIADKYGVSAQTIHAWLVKYNIARRHITFL